LLCLVSLACYHDITIITTLYLLFLEILFHSLIILFFWSFHLRTLSSESILIGGIWWKRVLTTMDRPVIFSPIGSPNSIIFIIYWWTIDVDCDWIFDWNSYIKAMTNLPAKTMCCCITELFEQLWVLYWTLINELLIILRSPSVNDENNTIGRSNRRKYHWAIHSG
jgi:hypothetical protein